jgi:hypothetical protein
MIRSALALVLVLLFSSQGPPSPSAGTITIDASRPGHPISSGLYGIFFEEISHAGDGGLYAELIQNRGFEDSRLPPMCIREGDFVIPPRTPHFDTGKPNDWRLRWNVASETPAWTLEVGTGARASMQLVDEQPLTPATPHSLRVDIGALGSPGRVAVVNDGYWGINVVSGESYDLSFHARNDGAPSGSLVASLE